MQRGEQLRHGEQRRGEVGVGHAGTARRAPLEAHDHVQARRGQQEIAERAPVRPRAGAWSGQVQHDHTGVHLAHALVGEAHPRQRTRAVVVDDGVRGRDQLEQEGVPLLRREVKEQRALRRVRVVELVPEVGREAAAGQRLHAHRIGSGVGLDLDHLGSEVGERARAEWPGEHPREVDHADALERRCGPLPLDRRGGLGAGRGVEERLVRAERRGGRRKETRREPIDGAAHEAEVDAEPRVVHRPELLGLEVVVGPWPSGRSRAPASPPSRGPTSAPGTRHGAVSPPGPARRAAADSRGPARPHDRPHGSVSSPPGRASVRRPRPRAAGRTRRVDWLPRSRRPRDRPRTRRPGSAPASGAPRRARRRCSGSRSGRARSSEPPTSRPRRASRSRRCRAPAR